MKFKTITAKDDPRKYEYADSPGLTHMSRLSTAQREMVKKIADPVLTALAEEGDKSKSLVEQSEKHRKVQDVLIKSYDYNKKTDPDGHNALKENTAIICNKDILTNIKGATHADVLEFDPTSMKFVVKESMKIK